MVVEWPHCSDQESLGASTFLSDKAVKCQETKRLFPVHKQRANIPRFKQRQTKPFLQPPINSDFVRTLSSTRLIYPHHPEDLQIFTHRTYHAATLLQDVFQSHLSSPISMRLAGTGENLSPMDPNSTPQRRKILFELLLSRHWHDNIYSQK